MRQTRFGASLYLLRAWVFHAANAMPPGWVGRPAIAAKIATLGRPFVTERPHFPMWPVYSSTLSRQIQMRIQPTPRRAPSSMDGSSMDGSSTEGRSGRCATPGTPNFDRCPARTRVATSTGRHNSTVVRKAAILLEFSAPTSHSRDKVVCDDPFRRESPSSS